MSFQIEAGVDLKNMKQVLGLYFLQHVPEDKMMNVFLVSGLRLKTLEILSARVTQIPCLSDHSGEF